MGNYSAFVTFIVGFLLLGAGCVVQHLYKTFKIYYFFSSYVGYANSQHILNHRCSERLYYCLSTIRKSVNDKDLFDVAMVTYSRRLSDHDIYEKTKAMLHAIDPTCYNKSNFEFIYTESEVQRYCFSLAGFSNKSDIIRVLLWLILINPVGVRKLSELY